MKRTNLSHFSHVLAAVQRTGSLPGGEIRGLPNGRSIDGLKGLHTFPLDLSEAQKEFQAGRIRSSLDRAKQLEIQFHACANRWDSAVYALINDIRQGKQLKNLEKLKDLKAAHLRMQQLVSPARKAFQDLVTALDHDATNKNRDTISDGRLRKLGSAKRRPQPTVRHESAQTSVSTVGVDGPPSDRRPALEELGVFADNYNIGAKLAEAESPDSAKSFAPKLNAGNFCYVSSLNPPRVLRIRSINSNSLEVFDTLTANEVVIGIDEFAKMVACGVWLLETNR